MSSGGGGESQPHLRVSAGTAQSINNSVRRFHQDLHAVARTMDDLFDRSRSSAGSPSATPVSSLAQHLASQRNPNMSHVSNVSSEHVSTVQTSPTTWQDNITVTVQPQLLLSPQSPSHVLDIEVFQPQQQHQQQQQQLPGDNLRGEQMAGGAASGEGENGWSAILNSNPEIKAVVSACEKYIPFLLIILVKSVFEHGTGIIVCCGLVLTFLHANSVLKQQVARQARTNCGALLAISINLIACILFIYFVFLDNNLPLSAFFIPPEKVPTFYDLLWIVGVNDFILKFLAVLSKILVTIMPAKFIPYQKRGKYYLFLEVSSQVHRQLAPLQPWLMYLLNSKGDGASSIPNKVLGVFLTAAYMVVKGKIFVKAIKSWREAFYKLLQSTRYGKTPTEDQLKATGGYCPICQDTFQEPTMLHCKHIFCEQCVATWFDRDTTCPMCRAKVSEDPSWRDGATSQFIQLF